MCGRYTIAAPSEAIRRMFGFRNPLPNLPARFNVAPTQDVPVVRLEGGVRTLAMVRWGLVPSWSKKMSPSAPLINARSESVADKPSFRQAFRLRRCLVPLDGFYEWQVRPDGTKQPIHIHLKQGGLFALAGLWENWTAEDGTQVESMALVTTSANATLQPVHDRMPVIVPPEKFDVWLDVGQYGPREVTPLMVPAPNDLLAFHPVSTRVNRVANDDPGLIAAIIPAPEEPPKIAESRPGKSPAKGPGKGQLDLF